jgi:hypothetical protein
MVTRKVTLRTPPGQASDLRQRKALIGIINQLDETRALMADAARAGKPQQRAVLRRLAALQRRWERLCGL